MKQPKPAAGATAEAAQQEPGMTTLQKPPLSLFLSYYKPHRKLLLLDLLCALGISLIDLAFPMATRHALQVMLPQGLFWQFYLLIGSFVLLYLLRTLMQFVITYWGHLLGARMEADMRGDLFSHLQKLSHRFYDGTRTGQLMSRVVNDLFEISELAHHGPEDLFISILMLAGSFIALMSIQWRLAIVLFTAIPLILAFVLLQRRNMSKASKEVKQKTGVLNAQLENSISGIRVAKAFTNEEFEIEKFGEDNNAFRNAKRGFYHAMAVFHSVMNAMTGILNVIVIGVGGLLIQRQLMSFADLVAFTLYVGAFLSPIQKLANFVEQYSAGMAGFTRFAELMALEPEIVDAPDAVTLGDVKGDIKFEDVSFAYKEGQTILNNISLDIPAGSTLALVGPSGGGKTTLCHLIPRFYDVISGRITLDGIDIAKIKLSSLRASIGIVQQDVFLFAGSIYDNIRYGRIDASEEEVIAAARQAEIHDFITGLADGYLTEVGERGIQLSGGQKQRVSIARIFLKNPPVLILDEATSALDTETESRIQASLDRLSAGRTTLVIAHRLTTVRHADSIVVIDEEGIRERGTHAELLARGGTYARLCRTAFRRDEQDGQDEKAALSAGMLINDTADPTACAVAEMEKTDAGTA